MTFDVLLTQKDQKYFAHVRQWPEIVAEGETEAKALAQAQADLKALLSTGRLVQLELDLAPGDHPWHRFAGMFAADPDWDAFQAAIAEDRQVIDAALPQD